MTAYLKLVVTVLDLAALLRAETTLEELLSNSIVHGGALALAVPEVWISADSRVDGLLMRHEDPFAAFNSMAKIEAALQQTAQALAQRLAGGLGLLMVFRLANEFRNLREGERNRVDLLFAARAQQRSPTAELAN